MKFLVLIITFYSCYCELTGQNVCTRKETYIEEVLISELKPYQVREFTWCISATFRCSKIVTKFKTEHKTQRLTKLKPVYKCCDGYTLNFNKTHCIPNCSKGCVQGKCVAPDVCQCFAGYGGFSCSFSCPLGLFGKYCQYNCLCKNNATCDALSGKCRCSDGWKGLYCDRGCKSGNYGKDCLEICKCNNGDCHHVSGKCKCHTGWTGDSCSDLVQDLNTTKKICVCLNNGICGQDNVTCKCTSGFIGKKCENVCSLGYWGPNCSQLCSCSNGATCNHITGECICLPGFNGHDCSDMCADNTYGKDCKSNCNCNNQGICSKTDGTCACFEGWHGISCNISLIPVDKQRLSCKCLNENFICDEDQKCICRDGYVGDGCDVSLNKHNWLLYGGIGLGIFLVICTIGIITNCVMSIKFFKRTGVYYSQRKSTLDLTSNPNNINASSANQETQFIYRDYCYVKPKDVNVYKEEHKQTDHDYEEINDNPSHYNSLIFNGFKNPYNARYQKVKNNLNLKINNIKNE